MLAINAAGQPGVSPLTHAELSAVLGAAAYCYVAQIDQQVVGYIIAYADEQVYDGEEFNWFKRRFARFLYIDQIAIAQAARRARAGSQIYRHMEQLARARALTSLVCEVNLAPPNPVSLSFHANNGFIEVGVIDTFDGRTVSLRRKELLATSTPGWM